MKILFDAVNSDHGRARVNGTVGLWYATHDLELILPLYFERIIDSDLKQEGIRDFGGAMGQSAVELGALSMAYIFHDRLNWPADKFLKELRKFAFHRDPKLRRSCVRYLEGCLENTLEEIKSNRKNSEFAQWVKEDIADLKTITELGTELANDSDPAIKKKGERIVTLCAQVEQQKARSK